MFVHIVFFRLKDDAGNGKSKRENAQEMQRHFHALRGQLPGLLRIDLGIDLLHTPDSADVALYTEFTDRAAYEHYAGHPLHLDIVGFIKGVRTDRDVADYEV
jgi:hypothetical protein